MKTLSPQAVDNAWEEARVALSDHLIVMDYLQHCNNLLVNVLKGQENPLETIFPEGSFETAYYIYNQWDMVCYFNHILKAILECATRNWPSNKSISIIEIGSGTGGTTAALLPILPANHTHYQFTDVSELFLSNAENRFREYPFVQYGLLDIEKDISEQGYPAHSYDFVIAANVIHATKNLEEVLENVLKLLKPGGLLLLYEVTNHLSWFDFTIGLIEGWHRFGDDWRRGHPLLNAQRWLDLLTSMGFENVKQFPSSGSPAEILSHHIIMGQTPKDTVYQEPIELLPGSGHREAKGTETAVSKSISDELKDQRIRAFEQALPDERQELMIKVVRDRLRNILRLDPVIQIDRRRRLMDLGVDSLMAVELRNTLGSDLNLKTPLSVTLVFDYPTVELLAEYLVSELEMHLKQERRSSASDDLKTAPTQSAEELAASAANIQDLSEEDVEALLIEKLKKMK